MSARGNDLLKFVFSFVQAFSFDFVNELVFCSFVETSRKLYVAIISPAHRGEIIGCQLVSFKPKMVELPFFDSASK
jgi:hypothetical protein